MKQESKNPTPIGVGVVRAMVILSSKGGASWTTIDIRRLTVVSVHVVLEAVPTAGSLTGESKCAIESYEVLCAPHALGKRIVLVNALTIGLTARATELNGKASREVNALYRYLANALEV